MRTIPLRSPSLPSGTPRRRAPGPPASHARRCSTADSPLTRGQIVRSDEELAPAPKPKRLRSLLAEKRVCDLGKNRLRAQYGRLIWVWRRLGKCERGLEAITSAEASPTQTDSQYRLLSRIEMGSKSEGAKCKGEERRVSAFEASSAILNGRSAARTSA